ncbi:uncharacterized protein [Manis javanica]|uniref:uncharacterized protein n=1 Tax=Manis javanica TaxID=9974 RepID=UPI003C6DB268
MPAGAQCPPTSSPSAPAQPGAFQGARARPSSQAAPAPQAPPHRPPRPTVIPSALSPHSYPRVPLEAFPPGLWDFTTPLWYNTFKMILNPAGPVFLCASHTVPEWRSQKACAVSRSFQSGVQAFDSEDRSSWEQPGSFSNVSIAGGKDSQAAQIPKASDPWSKEAVLLALNRWKRKKRTVEEEEDQTSAAGQEEKRRCHDSSGSGHSAFKPEVADGVPAAFVPEPGPLKRGLSSQSSDGELCKRTCTSAMSCSKGMCTCGIRMSSRNAITSSYTSTGGISQLWKRRPSASPFSSPASSRSQTPESPEKKMREEDGPQGSGSSAPPVNKESQGEQDTTTWREQNSWDSPVTPSSSQPCRCKFPLVPSRRGIPLMLPPAPWIGRLITVEEYYQEKQAQSQWLKRIFEDKTSIISGFGAVTQTTSCGTNTSVFGSTISSPFTSRVSAGPTGSGGFGMSMAAPHSSSTTGAFGVGSGRSGRTDLKNPFWGALKPNSLGAAGQSTPSAFHLASTPQDTSWIAAITLAFGAMTLTTSSETSRSSTNGTFSVGSGRSGRTVPRNPFWGELNPNSRDAVGQSTHPLPSTWPPHLRTHLGLQVAVSL